MSTFDILPTPKKPEKIRLWSQENFRRIRDAISATSGSISGVSGDVEDIQDDITAIQSDIASIESGGIDRIFLGASDMHSILGTPTPGAASGSYDVGWHFVHTETGRVTGHLPLMPQEWNKVNIYVWWCNYSGNIGNAVIRAIRNAHTVGVVSTPVQEPVVVITTVAQHLLQRTLLASGVSLNTTHGLGVERLGLHASDTLNYPISILKLEVEAVSVPATYADVAELYDSYADLDAEFATYSDLAALTV